MNIKAFRVEVTDMSLPVKLLSDTARLPTRGSAYAAGYDLYSDADVIVPKRGQALVSIGVAFMIPDGHYGRIAPRSGLAVKHSIGVNAGVLDCDWRGCTMVLLLNHGDHDLEVRTGDRIAQLILEKISCPPIERVEVLSETVRNVAGFGSTGR